MHLALATFGLGGGELLLLILIGIGLFVFPLWILPAILSFLVLERIPPQDRKQEPGLALLLLIPFFSMVWAFFVYPRISESLEAHFNRLGDRSAGDGGKTLAWIICICGLIPFVHLVSVICMIVFFAQAFTLTGRISREALSAGPSGAPQALL